MITFTETARQKVREYMDNSNGEYLGLRLRANQQGRHSFAYEFHLLSEGEEAEDDVRSDQEIFTVFFDPESAEHLKGSTVDFVSSYSGAGFKVDNPQAVPHWDDPIAQQVQKVIDEKVMPGLQGHGGWVELLDVKDNKAVVRLGGGCQGCGMAKITVKEGIEATIKEAVPSITEVLDHTEHGAGSNPYC